MRFLLQTLVSARSFSELQIIQEFWRMVLYHQGPKVANLAQKCVDTAHICTEICTKRECHKGTTYKLSQSQFQFWI